MRTPLLRSLCRRNKGKVAPTTASVLVATAIILGACSSIDCPLNNRVAARYKLAGNVTTLTGDSLTVSTPRSQAEGDDSVLVNKATDIDSITLPMSYSRAEDVFYFTFTPTTTEATAAATVTDTVWVEKQDEPHFEAVDCSPAVFHTVTGVRYTVHAIDSITINNHYVTYNDAKAHFLLYLKTDRH